MRSSRALRATLGAQGAYYVSSGTVPFVSRRAFEAVTGPKVDWWLVQAVSGLVDAVGVGLLAAAARDRATPELVAVAAGSALALGAVDAVHARRGRIAPVYLADAALQAGFLAALGACAARWRGTGEDMSDTPRQRPDLEPGDEVAPGPDDALERP